MSRLLKTLENIHNKQPLRSGEVAILFTIALTKERFKKEKKKPLFSFKKIRKEFVSLQTRYNDTWEHYKTHVVYPILDYLGKITKNTDITFIADATYDDFKITFIKPSIKLLILVAHHIQQADESAIEFTDRAILLPSIQEYINQCQTEINTSLMLIVCDTNNASKELYSSTNINSIFWASWGMPLAGGMNYIATFVNQIDEVKSISDIHHETLQAIINSLNTNQYDEPKA